MKKIILLLIVFKTFQLSAQTAPEKDKILFMIFENQNKKVSFENSKLCKKGDVSQWACQNTTVKSFLMNLMRIHAVQKNASAHNQITCEKITPELQKRVEGEVRVSLGSIEFRREIRQSLKDQWLCMLSAEQVLPQGVESFDDAKTFHVDEGGIARRTVGLSFIMNRDKNRIVSRKFAGWVSHQNM